MTQPSYHQVSSHQESYQLVSTYLHCISLSNRISPPLQLTMAAATMQSPSAPATNGHAGGLSEPAAVEGNLPASWYNRPAFYELERRAIFSKRWLLVTHRLRLPETGSFLRFQTAGFDYFLIKNRQGNIQAFHNVCRHRAYPIFDKEQPEQGKRSILSCGYHGMCRRIFMDHSTCKMAY